jgi:hypothetical protein
MPETFLILLAGGVMLAAAGADPRQVTLHWLRLAGMIALVMAGISLFFYFRGDAGVVGSVIVRRVQVGLFIATVVAILAQLAFVQVAWRRTQRVFAAAVFVLAVLAGSHVLHEMMTAIGTAVHVPPKPVSIALQTLACAGVAGMTGLALMDMLLGHAYLTASKMTIHPFRRLNLALAGVLLARAVLAIPVVLLLHRRHPVELLWGVHGLLILTRWLVGLAVPAALVYMADDCIRRRSTQSATGILYVAGVLVFIGEMIALYLVRATGLPF